MNEDKSINYEQFSLLIETQIKAGIDGLVVLGTTAEAPTLTAEEQTNLVQNAVNTANGRVPIIVGTGTNSTYSTVEKTKQAEQLGASAALVINPYYNKPTQEGLLRHYEMVTENTSLPIILYNHPGRTSGEIFPETIIKLSFLDNVIGVKECSGQLDRLAYYREKCLAGFKLWTGNDPELLDFLVNGGDGAISATANLCPGKVKQLCNSFHQGNPATAGQIATELADLNEYLFVESNPIPAKWALHQMGKIGPGIRLPLTPLAKAHHNGFQAVLKKHFSCEEALT